ncbi:MAG: protein kinase, partial [Planctomycetota bacterium]
MAELILPDGSVFDLPRRATTIGSSDEAAIRIGDSAEIHCVVRPLKNGGFGLKDLGSPEGTRINQELVRAVRLSDGDQIQIAGRILRFRDEGSAPEKPEAPRDSAEDSAGLAVGSRIGGYEIMSVLGHGGMGTVYQATQLSLHRKVALKILKQELADNPQFIEHFFSEARAAARFNHPNIVQVFDVDQADGRPFYSMELLEQGSLEEKLQREGKLSIEEAVGVIRDAARGLSYADEIELVHRDIKPDNLMLTAQGVTKICDLGLAGDPAAQTRNAIVGTPHFISPEQIRNQKVDHRSDLYSLGCTFYRLLTGKTPFPSQGVKAILKAHLEAPPPSLREALPEAPEELEGVIARLLAKDPDERYQHAAELAEELDAIFERQHAGHRGLLVTLGIVVLALALGIGYLLMQDSNGQGPAPKSPGNSKNEQLQKKLRESEATAAFLAIAKSLPPLERASALEAFAEEHAGTKASREALAEAEGLRKAERERLAAEERRRDREQALARKIREEADKLIADGKPVDAWQRARLLAGETRPAVVKDAVARVEVAVLAGLRKIADEALQTLSEGLGKATRPPEYQKLRSEFLARLRLDAARAPASAAALVNGYRVKGEEQLERANRAYLAAREKRLVEVLRVRRSTLMNKVIPLIRRGRFEEAGAELARPKLLEDLEEYWQPLERLRGMLGAADAAIQDALGDSDGSRRTVVIANEAYELVEIRDGKLILKRGKGVRGDERPIGLWESQEVLLQLFAPGGTDADHEARRIALFLATLIRVLPEAQRLLDALSSGQGSPTVDLPAKLMRVLARQKPASEPIRLELD